MSDEKTKCPACSSTNLHKKERWATIYFYCKDCRHKWTKDLGECLDTSLEELGDILGDSEKIKINEEEANKVVEDLLEMMKLAEKSKKEKEKKWSRLLFLLEID